ncbi:TetR family transcriptional regulator [Arthrobacter sp. Soil782]|uniref:TetR/AcrR family transcriptional regulator n=1 Tax=Arthrobacter sp. Soil782 TaxID=1736410 RepID=UPI0006FA28BD|nr:TetR/AcrR family transcriptional regulator [Arthrobacter sp. Soil782]KRF08977.1 TetR family transcriptional regulator [Arthrobacter sp. Soil782]
MIHRKRSTYRHGDLHRALVAAGTELAREGGPSAVVLREVTRRTGVTPNAAYRHFADKRALLHAVSMAAQAELARSIEQELSRIEPSGDASDVAKARLRAVGAGYLRYAQTQPGLFRTAFAEHADLRDAAAPDSAGDSGLTPFQLLSAALDGLVEAGVLPAERRLGAEFLAWSSVHGLAMLVIDGPLRGLDEEQRTFAARRLLEMVEKGL